MGGGRRESRRRRVHSLLSDSATALFLEHGFDAVRVADVAVACGVTEKTVFNHFPTKEALLLDRLDATAAALAAGLARPGVPPVRAALEILAAELAAVFAAHPDPGAAMAAHRRFGDLLRSTPSLRTHLGARYEDLVTVAARALAGRTGVAPDDPEPQVAAAALLGLWRVQAGSLRRHLDGGADPERVRRAVTADVERAALLLAGGMGGFGGEPRRSGSPQTRTSAGPFRAGRPGPGRGAGPS